MKKQVVEPVVLIAPPVAAPIRRTEVKKEEKKPETVPEKRMTQVVQPEKKSEEDPARAERKAKQLQLAYEAVVESLIERYLFEHEEDEIKNMAEEMVNLVKNNPIPGKISESLLDKVLLDFIEQCF